MKQKYIFDWCRFTEQDLLRLNRENYLQEDDIYGFILLTLNNERYIIDVHYEYYSSRKHGFDLEVYRSNEYEQHLDWIESCRGIKSATNYKRFCTRAENLIIEMFNSL